MKRKLVFKDPSEGSIYSLKTFTKNTYLAHTFANYVVGGESNEELSQAWKEMSDKYDYLIDPKNRTGHKPEYNGIDLSDALSCINAEIIFEHLMIIVLDENKIIDYKVIDRGTETQYGGYDVGKKIIEYLLQFVGPVNDYKIIFAHNHPSYVCAIPSQADKIQTMRLQILCQYLGFREVDNIVVTPYDMYSQYQWDLEHSDKKEKCLINRSYFTRADRAKMDEISESLRYLTLGL